MVLKENVNELDLTLNFSHEGFNYVIYATTNNMKCFGCGENGHLVRACPKSASKQTETVNVTTEKVAEVQEIVAVDEERPGPSRAPEVSKSLKKKCF